MSLPRGEEQNYNFFNMSVGGGVSLQRASQEPHKGARSARQILIAVAAAAAASFRSSLSQQPLAAASGSSLPQQPLAQASHNNLSREEEDEEEEEEEEEEEGEGGGEEDRTIPRKTSITGTFTFPLGGRWVGVGKIQQNHNIFGDFISRVLTEGGGAELQLFSKIVFRIVSSRGLALPRALIVEQCDTKTSDHNLAT